MSSNPLAAPWAVRLARRDAAAGAQLRLWPGVEVGQDESWLWLRGPANEQLPNRLWWGLPAAGRYVWCSGDRLRPLESRIPGDTLPALAWQSIERWYSVSLPTAALPGSAPRPAALRLVRSTAETVPELLVTTLADWVRYALDAPEIRLRPLQFAASGSHALIRGRPVPPLPGRRYVIHGGIAVPAGFHWDPPVSREVLIRRLNVGADALAVWHEDGTFTPVLLEQMIAATRSSVRATAHALSMAGS